MELLNARSVCQIIKFFSENHENASLQEQHLQSFAEKWNEIIKRGVVREKDNYQPFLRQLLGEVIKLTPFDGNVGEFHFERGAGRRCHDAVVGDIRSNAKGSSICTAFEVKSSDWNLDIDRNEEGELAIEQVEATSSCNPFLREMWVTNFRTFRFYSRRFGSSIFQEFTLESLSDDVEKRRLFLSLMFPEMMRNHKEARLRSLLQSLIEQSMETAQKRVDAIYDLYSSALNLATECVSKTSKSAGRISDCSFDIQAEDRQLGTLLVNRFLFSEYAFQRNLVGISPRDLIRKSDGKSVGKKLNGFFAKMDCGGSFHGQDIVKFNGGLFAENSRLRKIDFGTSFVDAIGALLEVDLSEMDQSVLGRIFERSLSEQLTSLPNAPAESCSFGAVYTPSDLARAMVKLSAELLGRTDDIVVLDPACGSGIFLLETLKYLLHKPEFRTTKNVKRILDSYLHGWDINPAAVELTRFMMWHYVLEVGLPLPSISGTILQADSLLDSVSLARDPDIVIGNPPFIAYQNLKSAYAEKISGRFPKICAPEKQFDLCLAFFQKSIDLVKEDGVISLIAPNQVSFRPYADELRKAILGHHNVERVVDLTELKVFDKEAAPFVYVIRKGRGEKKTFKFYSNLSDRSQLSDAFSFVPENTEFVELLHDPSREFLACGILDKSSSSALERIQSLVESGAIYARAHHLSDLLTKSPARGRAKSTPAMKTAKGDRTRDPMGSTRSRKNAKSSHSTKKTSNLVLVVTSKVDHKTALPVVNAVPSSKEEKSKYQSKYGERKIAIPRFFQSQMASCIFGSEYAVADNVYYILSNEVKSDTEYDLDLLQAVMDSRVVSIIDYARRGTDRINDRGFRALDGEKLGSIVVPRVSEKEKRKTLTLYKKLKGSLPKAEEGIWMAGKGKRKVERTLALFEFELQVLSLFGIQATRADVKKMLTWWSKKRKQLNRSRKLEQVA